MSTVAQRLRACIDGRHMTQADTAQRLGISPQYLSDVLRGRRKVSPRLALRIERVLGLDAGAILHGQVTEELKALRKRGNR